MITGRNLHMHELIGLKVRVVDGSSRTHVGIEGIVIDETLNMLVVESGGNRLMIPKIGQVFMFLLSDGTWKRLRGDKILNRPENRIKRGIKYY